MTPSMVFILFERVSPQLSKNTTIMQDSFVVGSPECLIGKGFIVSSKQGICVQASNWRAAVAFTIIGWCWESIIDLTSAPLCIGGC